MKSAAVSVVMPVWNASPGALRGAVRSLIAQTLSDWELLVVEDPSERPAAAVLREFCDARIRHVVNPARTSMAAARNAGLRLARSALVAMLDSDDICEPHRLEAQHAFLHQNADIAVLGTQISLIDDRDRPLGHRVYPCASDAILRQLRVFNPIAHPSVMLRRDLVLEVGGYHACVCEDYDLWCRLAQLGHRFANLDRALLRYRIHDGASKSRRLHATLRDTLRIKREYWRGQLGLRDRARMLGERALLLLPSRVVMALFLRTTVRRRAALKRA